MKTLRLMTLFGMLGVAAAALALDLPDPMRPPMGLGGARSAGGMAAPDMAGGGASGPARAKVVAPSRARLTAVMLADAPGVNAAVIDGKVYRAGERLPDGLLLAGIDANGVTLRDGGGRTRRLAVYDRPAEASSETDQAKAPAAASEPASVPQAEPAAAAASDLSSPAGAKAPGKDQP